MYFKSHSEFKRWWRSQFGQNPGIPWSFIMEGFNAQKYKRPLWFWEE